MTTLAFLYCGEFVKTSIISVWFNNTSLRHHKNMWWGSRHNMKMKTVKTACSSTSMHIHSVQTQGTQHKAMVSPELKEFIQKCPLERDVRTKTPWFGTELCWPLKSEHCECQLKALQVLMRSKRMSCQSKFTFQSVFSL